MKHKQLCQHLQVGNKKKLTEQIPTSVLFPAGGGESVFSTCSMSLPLSSSLTSTIGSIGGSCFGGASVLALPVEDDVSFLLPPHPILTGNRRQLNPYEIITKRSTGTCGIWVYTAV